MPTRKGGFRGVSLKAELVDQVENFVEKSFTYRSISEFISESVRNRLRELSIEGVSKNVDR